MKKNIIALAIAGALAAPLAAQADVTVSGSLQAELDSSSNDAATPAKPDGLALTNGGRGKVEFKASEDLGGGMKAIAKYGMNATATDNQKTPVTSRDAYIGLSGGFGTILVGTMSTPYKSSTVGWDTLLETGGQARGHNSMSPLHSGYASNAIAYANKFGPAKVVAAVVIDEGNKDAGTGDTSMDGDNAYSLSVNVPFGPVEVAVAYADASKFSDLSQLGASSFQGTSLSGLSLDTFTATKLGVKYSAGAIGVAAQYETIDTGAKDNVDYVYLNGTYTMGANTFALSFGQNDDGTNTDTTTSLAAIHGFSKNTMVYAAYVADKDENGSVTNDSNTAALGMRVNF